jgi:nitrate reductase NapE component
MATHTQHLSPTPHARHPFAIITTVVLVSVAFVGAVGFFLTYLATS